jgi:hypothetical protein
MAESVKILSSSITQWNVLVQAEERVVDLIEKAVNSSEMDELPADQVVVFAQALNLPTAGLQSAILADPKWRKCIPSTIHWKSFRVMFGEFEPNQQSIFLDNSLIGACSFNNESKDEAAVLMFIKGIHGIGHALTEYCLATIKKLHPRKQFSLNSTPKKAGTFTKKINNNQTVKSGDAGNTLEELLSGKMRFTYEWANRDMCRIKHLTIVYPDGKGGFYVPDTFAAAILQDAEHFYSICKALLHDHSKLQHIDPTTLKNDVVKNAHGESLNYQRIDVKY